MEKQEHSFAKINEDINQAALQEKTSELKDLHERLSLIVRAICGKLNLEVTTDVDLLTLLAYAKKGEDARKIWFRQVVRDPKTKKFIKELVHIPKEIAESNENVAKGKAAHEAGHVLITRHADFVPDDVLQQPGFHALLQAVEERPTDQVVRERYSGAGLWVDESRKEGNQRYRALSDEKKKALGYIPKFKQFAYLCVYAPHYEERLPYAPDVLEAFEKVKEHVETVEKTLPAEGAVEKEVIKKAKERYSLTYFKIWPEMEKLVQKDLELEKLRKMLEQAMAGGEGEKGEKGKGGESAPEENEAGENRPDPAKLRELLNQLPEALKNELNKVRLPKKQAGIEEKEKFPPETEKDDDKTEQNGAGDRETAKEAEGEAEEERKEKGENDQNGKAEKGEVAEPDGGDEVKSEGAPVSMDQISEELKKELQKIFDTLTEEEKEFIQHIAQKVLEQIEDEIVREFSGKLAEEEPETHAVYEARKEKEEKRKQRQETEERLKKEKTAVQYELKEIEIKQAKISENKDEYMRAYEEVRELDEVLYRKLEEVFNPNIKRNIKMKSAGIKPNMLKVFKWEAGIQGGAKALDSKIFESAFHHEKKDYAFSIVNDMSGSMLEYDKIEHDFKAKVLLCEVLNRLGIRFSASGFNTKFYDFKNYAETMNDTVRKKMNKIKQIDRQAYTDTGKALITASRQLEKEYAKEKFLLVLTDGVPFAPGRDVPAETHKAISDILKNTRQKLIGVGLGQGTAFVREYFPASLVEEDVKKLTETLAVLLEDMILNPEKYAYQEQGS